MAKSNRSVSSVIEGPTLCNLCETGVGVHSKCLECGEFLCENCRRVHAKGKATKDHKIVQIFSTRDGVPFTKVVKCADHEKCDVIMYCKNCETLVCSECIAITHSGHLFEQIDSVYDQKVRQLESRLDRVENDALKEVSIQLKRVKFKRRHKKSEVEFLKERIVQLTEVQKKMLEKRRNVLLMELDKHMHTSEEVLFKAISSLNQTRVDLKECQENIQAALSSCERIRAINMANETQNNLNRFDFTNIVPIIESPVFEKNELSMETCLGILSFSVNTNGGDAICETTNGVKLETSIAGVLDTDYRFISSVCQMSGGYCWIGCSGGDSITLVNHGEDLQVVSKCSITADDIAYCDAENLLVSCPDDHVIRKVSTVDDATEIFLDVSPLFPTALHVNSQHDILVSMVEGHRYSFKVDSQRKVVRFSADKNIKSEYQFAGTKRLFTYPFRLNDNINSDVCIVDKSGAFTGRLVVLEQSGGLKFTYTGNSSVSQKSNFDPRDVVCDTLGRIFISDCGNHSVHILDQEGDIVCHINTLKLGIKYPWSLSFESYVKLWVGCKAEPEKGDNAKLYIVETDIDQSCS